MSSRRNSLGAYCTQWAEVPGYDSDQYEEYINHLADCEYHLALEDEFSTEFEQQDAEPSRFPLPARASISDLTGDLHSSTKSLSELEEIMRKAYEFCQSGGKITALEFRASGKRLARISFSKWRFRRQPKPIVVRKAIRSVQIWEPYAQVLLGMKAIDLNINQVEELKFNRQRVKIKESLDKGKVVLTTTCEPLTSTFWEQMADWIKQILVPVLVIYGLKELWQKLSYLIPAQWMQHGFAAALLVFIMLPSNCPDKSSTNNVWSDFKQKARLKYEAMRISDPVLPEAISKPVASNYPVPSAHPPTHYRVVTKRATAGVAREVWQAVKQIVAAPNPGTEQDYTPAPPSTALAVTEASKSEPITFSVMERGEDEIPVAGEVVMDEFNSMLKEELDQTQPIVSDSQQAKGLVYPVVCETSPYSSVSTLYMRVRKVTADGKEEPLSTKTITRKLSSCGATTEELRAVMGEMLVELKEGKNDRDVQRSKKDALAEKPGEKSQATTSVCDEW